MELYSNSLFERVILKYNIFKTADSEEVQSFEFSRLVVRGSICEPNKGCKYGYPEMEFLVFYTKLYFGEFC
jgi:hypothetical protein